MITTPSGNGRIARSIRELAQASERQRVLSTPGTLVTSTPRGQFTRTTPGTNRGRGTGNTYAIAVYL